MVRTPTIANLLLVLSFLSVVGPAACRKLAKGEAQTAGVSYHYNVMESAIAEAGGGESEKVLLTGQAAIDEFKADPEVGALLGSLIDGIKDAGLLDVEAVSFDTPEPEPSNPTLTLKTSTGDTIFGEIASKSRVPVAWKVQGELSFQIDRSAGEGATRVAVTGLGTYPSLQGLALYEDAMNEAKLKPADCDGTDHTSLLTGGCIKKEMEAAGAYLTKTSYMKYVNYNKIADAPGKLSQVLKTSFGDKRIWAAVNAKREWPKIFYSMITAAPLQITGFVFEGGAVYAESTPDTAADPRYARYHLVAKSNMMGEKSLADARLTMGIAETFASSGMAFAKMLAFGKSGIRAEMEKIHLTAAKPEALENLFALCQMNLNSGAEGPTQNPQCSGKCNKCASADAACLQRCAGRVWWGTTPGEAFTDMSIAA